MCYIFRLLLGSVNHSLKFGTTSGVDCKPIPLEASCHIADHIQVRYSTWKNYNTIFEKSTLNGELKMIFHFSGHIGWVCRAKQNISSTHVLIVSCLYSVSALDCVS